MATITLRGREIPLIYTTYEMKQVQEEIGPIGNFQYALFGRNREDEEDTSRFMTPEHLETVAKAVRIFGNAGLEESGQDADLTDKWILRAIRPAQLNGILMACMETIRQGMASEIPDEKGSEPVDVVLEQINKKKEAGS